MLLSHVITCFHTIHLRPMIPSKPMMYCRKSGGSIGSTSGIPRKLGTVITCHNYGESVLFRPQDFETNLEHKYLIIIDCCGNPICFLNQGAKTTAFSFDRKNVKKCVLDAR